MNINILTTYAVSYNAGICEEAFISLNKNLYIVSIPGLLVMVYDIYFTVHVGVLLIP